MNGALALDRSADRRDADCRLQQVTVSGISYLHGLNRFFPRGALCFSVSTALRNDVSDQALIDAHLLAIPQQRQTVDHRIFDTTHPLARNFLAGVAALLMRGEIPGTRAVAIGTTDGADPLFMAIAWPDEGQARTAVDLVRRLLSEGPDPDLGERIRSFSDKLVEHANRPILSVILEAAERKGVPWRWQDRLDLCQLGYGHRRHWCHATITGKMSAMGYHIARRKPTTNALLAAHAIPAPRQIVVNSLAGAEDAAKSIAYPVVVKPAIGHKGIGVTVGVRDRTELAAAFAAAQKSSRSVIVESILPGSDVRLLVVNGRMVAAAMRAAPSVSGDGQTSIEELIARENELRATSKGRALPIVIDAALRATLAKIGLDLGTVPAAGQKVTLRSVANWSQGGVALDVTSLVHPDNADMAVRAALAVGLDVAGIDFITPDVTRPYHEVGGGICEVNYHPGLRVHLAANPACRKQLGDALVDNMMPAGGRIPVVAVVDPAGDEAVQAIASTLAQLGVKPRIVKLDDLAAPHPVPAALEDIDCEALVVAGPVETFQLRGLGVDHCDAIIRCGAAGAALDQVCAMLRAASVDLATTALHDLLKAAVLRHGSMPTAIPADPADLAASPCRSVIETAQRLAYPVNAMVQWSKSPLQRIGHGSAQGRYRSARSGRTSYVATTIADDKRRTSYVLQRQGLPVVRQRIVRSLSDARAVVAEIGYPVILKPAGASESRGVSGRLATDEELAWALKRASKFDQRMIIEPFLEGKDHRFLVVRGRAIHVTQHDTAHIVGDGSSTIVALVARENQNPLRGPAARQPYAPLNLNDDALRTLRRQGLDADSIPPVGMRIDLSSINSLSTGGTAIDVTATAHPANVAAAERAARLIGLDICGVDFLLPDVTRAYTETGGAILEVNQRPSFDMHDAATNWNSTIREAIVRAVMAESGVPVQILRVAIAEGLDLPALTWELAAKLTALTGRTVGVVGPGASAAVLGRAWIVELHGGPHGVVNGLLADPRLEAAIFLETGAVASVAPAGATQLPDPVDPARGWQDLDLATIASRLFP